jgi:hypothetical protein
MVKSGGAKGVGGRWRRIRWHHRFVCASPTLPLTPWGTLPLPLAPRTPQFESPAGGADVFIRLSYCSMCAPCLLLLYSRPFYCSLSSLTTGPVRIEYVCSGESSVCSLGEIDWSSSLREIWCLTPACRVSVKRINLLVGRGFASWWCCWCFFS